MTPTQTQFFVVIMVGAILQLAGLFSHALRIVYPYGLILMLSGAFCLLVLGSYFGRRVKLENLQKNIPPPSFEIPRRCFWLCTIGIAFICAMGPFWIPMMFGTEISPKMLWGLLSVTFVVGVAGAGWSLLKKAR